MSKYTAFNAHYNGHKSEIWAIDKDQAKEKAARHYGADPRLVIVQPLQRTNTLAPLI
jgi:hypothetical protein